MPAPDDPAFQPDDTPRWDEVREAWEAIGPMFWGDRVSLEVATSAIRAFLVKLD